MLQSLYCLCFYLFTIEKVASFRGIVLTALFVGALQLYIHNEPELATAQLRLGKKRETINRVKFSKVYPPYLGLLSSSMSVLYCAAPLSTAVTVIKTKSTDSLPFNLILATITMTGSWSMYGLIIRDNFVIVPNLLGFFISTAQMSLFAMFDTSGGEKYIV